MVSCWTVRVFLLPMLTPILIGKKCEEIEEKKQQQQKKMKRFMLYHLN